VLQLWWISPHSQILDSWREGLHYLDKKLVYSFRRFLILILITIFKSTTTLLWERKSIRITASKAGTPRLAGKISKFPSFPGAYSSRPVMASHNHLSLRWYSLWVWVCSLFWLETQLELVSGISIFLPSIIKGCPSILIHLCESELWLCITCSFGFFDRCLASFSLYSLRLRKLGISKHSLFLRLIWLFIRHSNRTDILCSLLG